MKTKITFILISLSLLMACTHNNGDIGELFGRWRLESLTADGTEVKLYDDETLLYAWSFQSSLLFIQVIQPYNSYYNVKGTWSRDDDILRVNFGYTGNDGEMYYAPPENLHLDRGVNDLEILRFTSEELILEKIGENEVKYVYRLKKAY